METVESRIRKLYIGSIIFIHIVSFATIAISASYLRDIFYTEKRVMAATVITVVMIYLITVWKELMNAKKIVVDSNCIKIYNVGSVYEIDFSEIYKIQKEKISIMRIRGVPLTDGYTYSKIILRNGKSQIISPDKFENYSEIMSFIKSELEKSHFA